MYLDSLINFSDIIIVTLCLLCGIILYWLYTEWHSVLSFNNFFSFPEECNAPLPDNKECE